MKGPSSVRSCRYSAASLAHCPPLPESRPIRPSLVLRIDGGDGHDQSTPTGPVDGEAHGVNEGRRVAFGQLGGEHTAENCREGVLVEVDRVLGGGGHPYGMGLCNRT